jgi:hypothetical protein
MSLEEFKKMIKKRQALEKRGVKNGRCDMEVF